MGRKRLVQSSPVRVTMLTLPPAMRAPVRYPSILISCNHRSPAGAYLASLASCGAMKLGGGRTRLDGSALRVISELKFARGPGSTLQILVRGHYPAPLVYVAFTGSLGQGWAQVHGMLQSPDDDLPLFDEAHLPEMPR